MHPIFKLQHGGRRLGAGRPPAGNVTLAIRVKPETRDIIRHRAGRKWTAGQIVERAIIEQETARRARELARLL